jgi:superfamily II DNA/RNA helicase
VALQVKKELLKAGHAADDIHGDRSQSQRESALAKFRDGAVAVLVCAITQSRERETHTPNSWL